MRTRRNQRSLSALDRQRLVAAINETKRSGAYDWFVQSHWKAAGMTRSGKMSMMGNYAHMGPAFCPWHRRFILDFEDQLQAADKRLGQDGTLTLAYWDWTQDQSPAGTPWTADLLGPSGSGPGHRVASGPFADWQTWVPPSLNYPNYLVRDLGGNGSLPSPSDVTAVLAISQYDSSPFNTASQSGKSFRNTLEGWLPNPPHLHNAVHVWVGGTMDLMSSPNDPAFFLHHANVDRIWWRWQKQHPGAAGFPTRSTGGKSPRKGHGLDDQMPPWDGKSKGPTGAVLGTVTARSVMDTAALGYGYA